MDTMIEVTIPVDAETAVFLQHPEQRAVAGRYLGALLRDGGMQALLGRLISEMRAEAHKNGATDEAIDAELEQWRNERRT